MYVPQGILLNEPGKLYVYSDQGSRHDHIFWKNSGSGGGDDSCGGGGDTNMNEPDAIASLKLADDSNNFFNDDDGS